MPGHTSASLVAAVSLAVALTACGSVVTPPATGPSPSITRSAAASPGPPAGSRAEAAALARQLLARLRADAQVMWYPPRSTAEYIDPARYHVLILVVTIFGRNPHTVRKIVTSQPFIARLAETLDRAQAETNATVVCPADFEDYQLSFSVSKSSRPAVTVQASETGCGGAQVTVNGQSQPSLADDGTIGALVRQVVPVTPEI